MKTLSFGEILWDIFPDSRCLGGAPLNVAGHLARLGFESFIISSVGNDELGKEALHQMTRNNVNTQYVYTHPEKPTGFTEIKLTKGIPEYEFNFPCAWDYIGLSEADLKAIDSTGWDLFCFGTLAQRSVVTLSTLKRLLPSLDVKIVFFDVNFRKSFYSKEILEWSFTHCDIIKMNDEESPVIQNIMGMDAMSEKDFYFSMIEKFNLKGILVTRGKEGVSAFFEGKEFSQKPSDVTVVDTVGAGDSFSAAFLASLLAGKDVPESLLVATALADYVVSHSGALPEYDSAITLKLAEIIR